MSEPITPISTQIWILSMMAGYSQVVETGPECENCNNEKHLKSDCGMFSVYIVKNYCMNS